MDQVQRGGDAACGRFHVYCRQGGRKVWSPRLFRLQGKSLVYGKRQDLLSKQCTVLKAEQRIPRSKNISRDFTYIRIDVPDGQVLHVRFDSPVDAAALVAAVNRAAAGSVADADARRNTVAASVDAEAAAPGRSERSRSLPSLFRRASRSLRRSSQPRAATATLATASVVSVAAVHVPVRVVTQVCSDTSWLAAASTLIVTVDPTVHEAVVARLDPFDGQEKLVSAWVDVESPLSTPQQRRRRSRQSEDPIPSVLVVGGCYANAISSPRVAVLLDTHSSNGGVDAVLHRMRNPDILSLGFAIGVPVAGRAADVLLATSFHVYDAQQPLAERASFAATPPLREPAPAAVAAARQTLDTYPPGFSEKDPVLVLEGPVLVPEGRAVVASRDLGIKLLRAHPRMIGDVAHRARVAATDEAISHRLRWLAMFGALDSSEPDSVRGRQRAAACVALAATQYLCRRDACDTLGVILGDAPAVPRHFLPRFTMMDELTCALCSLDPAAPRVLALTSHARACGKACLARAVAERVIVRQRFPDGVVWLRVPPGASAGAGASIEHLVRRAMRLLTGREPSAGASGADLRAALASRRALVIMLGASSPLHLSVFAPPGASLSRLLVTADAAVAAAAEMQLRVPDGVAHIDHADQLLSMHAARPVQMPADLPRHPLALALLGYVLRNSKPDDDVAFWRKVSAAVSADAAAGPTPAVPGRAAERMVAVALDASHVLLVAKHGKAKASRVLAAAAVVPDADVTSSTAMAVLGVQSDAALDAALTIPLAAGLLVPGAVPASFRVLAPVHAWMQGKVTAKALVGVHKRVVHAFRHASGNEADPYWLQHAGHHLSACGLPGVHAALLLQPAWLFARLASAGVDALLADLADVPRLGRVKDDAAIDALHDVLRAGRDTLLGSSRHAQLPFLLSLYADRALLSSLVSQTLSLVPLPARATLSAPFELARTVRTSAGWVTGLNEAEDHTLVACGSDGAIRRIDAVSGQQLSHRVVSERSIVAIATLPGTRGIAAVESGSSHVRLLQPSGSSALQGHEHAVQCVTAVDDTVLASADVAGGIILWDLERRTVTARLAGHVGAVTALVAVTKRYVLSAGVDGSLRVWDLALSSCKTVLIGGHAAAARCAAVLAPSSVRASSRGPVVSSRIISGGDDAVLFLWDWNLSREPIASLRGHSAPVQCVAAHPRRPRAVSGSLDRTLRLWNTEDGTCLRTLVGHVGWINDVLIMRDNRIISASDDRTIAIWSPPKRAASTSTSRSNASFTSDEPGIAISAAATTAATSTSTATAATMHRSSVSSRRRHRRASSAASSVSGASSSTTVSGVRTLGSGSSGEAELPGALAGGDSVTQGSADSAADGRNSRSSVSSSTPRRRSRGWSTALASVPAQAARQHRSEVSSIAYVSGHVFASVAWDGDLRLWSWRTATCVATTSAHIRAASCLANPVRGVVLTGGLDGALRVWNVSPDGKHCVPGSVAVRTEPGAYVTAIATLATAPDYALVGFRSGRIVRWHWKASAAAGDDPDGASTITSLSSLGTAILAIQPVSGEPTHLACASAGGQVAVWRIQERGRVCERILTCMPSDAPVRCMTGLADGLLALGTADGRILVLAAADGAVRVTIPAHTGAVLACSAYGLTRVISSGEDRLLRIWDWDQGICKVSLSLLVAPASALCLGKRQLSVGLQNGAVAVFDIPFLSV